MAATGVAALAGAGAAFAQERPASVGDGVPTGQGSVQLFNYGTYISSGGNTGAANPITSVPPAADGSSCVTGTSTECRWNRLDALFGFLASEGVTSVELFGHAGLPTNDNIEGPFGWKQYRALLDKHGLHAAAWHGSMNEAAWPARVAAAKVVGMDYIGSGGVADPGIGSLDATLASARALTRMGKYAVENGVGPTYIHNHTGEFDAKYVHNGTLKTAFDILMEETDPRYVTAELDVFWSSDAFNDESGTASAALINKYASRIKQLHMKDGINVATQPSPTNSRGGSPRAFGTGVVDFRPILTAAKNRVQYFHQEQDGGTLTDADISLSNLKGVGPNVVGTPQMLPTTFTSVPAGTPATDNVTAVKVTNVGDAPLTITAAQLASSTNQSSTFAVRQDETPGDFQVISNAACLNVAIAPKASCEILVGFKPTRTNANSVARLVLQSGADDATEQVRLVGRSTGDASGNIGGDVASILSLTLGGAPSFGAFQPAVARTYETASSASVVSTAGDATLSVTDASSTAPGHLVNGAFALPQALQVRARNAASPSGDYVSLSETAGTPVSLLTYSGPTAGADAVTLGFRQAIGATDTLRSGTYSKTLTFTLSTTTP
jgi:sugar phosphate isomerase/epimerase